MQLGHSQTILINILTLSAPKVFLSNILVMSIRTKLLYIIIISLLMVKDWYQYSDYGNDNKLI